MNRQQPFSDVTKEYLCCYYQILDEMIRGMTDVELTDSLSRNFIVQMIPHHEGAIKMSCNILQYTTCVPLQNIATNIIAEQTKSIENMQSILKSCSKCANSECDRNLYQRSYRQITQRMFCEMQNVCQTNNINRNFIREMIPHHRGAIRMSESLLCYPVCQELCPILHAIIVSQKKGIREMARLLQCTAE